MQQIITDIQNQTVDHIQSGLTDDNGSQHAKVELIHTEDEFEIADFVAENQRKIGRVPHAFVFVGNMTFQDQDTTHRLQQVDVPVRVFVAVRDSSQNNERVQHRLAGKWCVYVASALAGKEIDVGGMAPAYLADVNVENIVNIEEWALWEVNFNVRMNMDTDDILSQLSSE